MADLCNLEDVQAFLGIEPGGDDEQFLSRLITTQSAYFETACGRIIAAADYTDTFNGSDLRADWASAGALGLGSTHGCDVRFVSLRNMPVIEVVQVTVDNEVLDARDPSDVTAPGWVLDNNRVALSNASRFTGGLKNIVVEYRAGWESDKIPADIADAVVQLVAFRFRERAHFGLTSKGLGGESVSFIREAMPPYPQAVIDAYRLVVVG